jgi:hypothetical protein
VQGAPTSPELADVCPGVVRRQCADADGEAEQLARGDGSDPSFLGTGPCVRIVCDEEAPGVLDGDQRDGLCFSAGSVILTGVPKIAAAPRS